MKPMENIIYLTPEAIKEHFEGSFEDGDRQDDFSKFITSASKETLYEIGAIAYWDDRIWDAFNQVVNDAALYLYRKQKESA